MFYSVFWPSYLARWFTELFSWPEELKISVRITLGIIWACFLPFFIFTIYIPYVAIFYLLKFPLAVLGYNPSPKSKNAVNRALYLIIEIIPSVFAFLFGYFTLTVALSFGLRFFAGMIAILLLVLAGFLASEVFSFISLARNREYRDQYLALR